jgi:NitT/TauT family transport system permease protein
MAAAVEQVPVVRRPRVGHRTRLVAGWLAVPIVVLLVWEIVSTQSDLVPSVADTIDELVASFTDGWIWAPLGDSARAVAIGFLVACALGVPAGAVLGASRYLGSIFDPLLTGLFAIPRVVFYPVLLAAFGIGATPKVALAVISAFFPIAISTAAAVREVDPVLVKLGRATNCGRLGLMRRIYLPAAMPGVMVGVRIGLSIAFISVIIAELFAATEGLGLLLQRTYALQQLPRMFAVVLLISILALASNLALLWLERHTRSRVA